MKIKDHALMSILLGQQFVVNAFFFAIPIPFLKLIPTIILAFFVFRLGFKQTFLISSVSSIFGVLKTMQGNIMGLALTQSLVDITVLSPELITLIHSILTIFTFVFIPFIYVLLDFMLLIGLAFLLKRFKFHKRVQGALK